MRVQRTLQTLVFVAVTIATAAATPQTNDQDTPEIPGINRPGQPSPPKVPGPEASVERAKGFVQALRHDDPELAIPFFFPRAAFRQVKAIKNPDRYFDRLIKVYRADVNQMRTQLRDPATVEFVSFELGRKQRWMPRGKEGNALPYYATYKARLTVKDAGRQRVLPMRVMINWGDGWYVTHLTNK